MREYEQTHPWISFELSKERFSQHFWMLLGEAASKCEHIAGVPLSPKVAEELHRVYLAKGVLATTAIEGNTLTEQQVRERIDGELSLPPSQAYLGQEIDNIVSACNQVINAVFDGDYECSVEKILEYNRIVLSGIPIDENVEPGQFRAHSVIVGNVYRGAPAPDVEYLTRRLCAWMNEDWTSGMQEHATAAALLKAIIAHLYVAWIHPFGDGNGRTARLIEYQILLGAGVPSPAAHLLSNHYNKTRTQYYRFLDLASKKSDGLNQFVHYALQGFVDGLKEELATIRKQQWDVAWRNHVYASFGEATTPAARRQRMLVLELTEFERPVPVGLLRSASVNIANGYAQASWRLIYRDVESLVKMNLVKRVEGGVVANREKILAFLPFRNIV